MRRRATGFTLVERPAVSRRKCGAFTLVELLVVIGIIAILIAMLLPVLNKAKQSANNAACLSNLHQMGLAIAMYTNLHKGTLPFGWWGDYGNGTGGNPGPGEADWTTLLTWVTVKGGGNRYADYLENTNQTSSAAKYSLGVMARSMFTDKDTLDYPSAPQNQWIHYAAHPRLMPAIGNLDYATAPAGSPNSAYKPLLPYNIARIRRATEIVLIMDSTQISNPYVSTDLEGRASATNFQLDGHNLDGGGARDTTAGCSYYYSGRPTATNGVLGNVGPAGPNSGCIVPGPNIDCSGAQFTGGTDGEIRWRHMGNRIANFLFVDGHCEGRAYKDQYHCDLLRRNVNVDATN
jgi:prepilin-type processing-associated H-X9-DG protein/prepilin-type N-terminal cleavage/methylation domain-containing protein